MWVARRLALALPVCLASLHCSPSIDVIVVDAVVGATCVPGGDCSEPVDRVSVGHCGDGVWYDDESGVMHLVDDRELEELAVVVAVRHDEGEPPADAANGGHTRGFIVAQDRQVEVEGLLQPGAMLYVIDDAGDVVDVDASAVREQTAQRLAFAYRVGDLEVTEVHTIVVDEPRPVEQLGSEHILASCCASVDASTTSGWLVIAAVVARRRRPRRP